MYAIETDNLSKTFRDKKLARVNALKNVELRIPAGEVFGFLGPNGAGKSTTIKILMGLISPTAGSATLDGCSCRDHSARFRVGYLPENPAFYDYLTAEEYLVLVGKIFKMDDKALNRSKEQVLKRIGLWDARRRSIRGYSKGMVQRLGLAQVLLHDPDIYILDEPMSGLDPVGRALVKDIILELRSQKKTVFFSTHITADVEVLCDRIGILVDGVLRESCRIDELIMEEASSYFHVKYRSHCDAEILEIDIARAELSRWISENCGEGYEIISINSQQKSLEKFFLETVSRASF
jgi:ABC-2 type transport system ATP-binding protein